jgi:hypothetical protein
MAASRGALHEIAAALRKRKTRKLAKGPCPSICDSQFYYHYLTVRWMAKHREVPPLQFLVDDGIF